MREWDQIYSFPENNKMIFNLLTLFINNNYYYNSEEKEEEEEEVIMKLKQLN